MNNNTQHQKTLDEMINHIAKEKNIRNLLSRYEIANIEEINGIKHYEHDDDRRGLIVDVKEYNGFGRTKILIDLRLVKPSIYQVYDALYDIGKDCDIKIIIHTKNSIGFDETNPVADEHAVLSLITQLQENNVAVGLFEIDRSNMEIEYIDWFQDWYQVNRLSNCNIPTREQFMAQTFWAVYFNSIDLIHYSPDVTFNSGFRDINDCGYLICIDNCPIRGRIKLYWNQEGVRYVIRQTDGLVGFLNEVLDIEMPWIFDRYGVGGVEFKKTDEQSSSLQIKYSDRPFDWLYTATPTQIYEFAKSMHEDAYGLRWRLIDTIDGYRKSVSTSQ